MLGTNKSPLYFPWLLIICVSDEIVVTSQLYKFHSHMVVMSQSINKKFGAPTPVCFVYKQVNAQPYKNNFDNLEQHFLDIRQNKTWTHKFLSTRPGLNYKLGLK
jgi:hypothetical protein